MTNEGKRIPSKNVSLIEMSGENLREFALKEEPKSMEDS